MGNINNVKNVRGDTQDLVIDHDIGIVRVGDEVLTDDPQLVSMFHKGYVMGREHKKKEIQKVLGIR